MKSLKSLLTDNWESLSLADLRSLQMRIVEEHQKIEFQLADKDRRDGGGYRMHEHEYHKWRHDILLQLSVYRRELAQVKARIAVLHDAKSNEDNADMKLLLRELLTELSGINLNGPQYRNVRTIINRIIGRFPWLHNQ